MGSTYAPGDKVIQRVNNYDKDVFNGDIGIILSIDVEQSLLGHRQFLADCWQSVSRTLMVF